MFKIGTPCHTGTVSNSAFSHFPNTNLLSVKAGHFSNLTPSKQYDKINQVVSYNLQSLRNQIKYIGSLDPQLRMLRISSSLLPLIDHPELYSVYDSTLMQKIETSLNLTGSLAKQYGIRLSSHPDQFNVLNSDRPEVVAKSINTLRHECNTMRMLGYTKSDGCVVNVHINGKTDVLPTEDVSDIFEYLSIENDETNGNLERTLKIAETYNIPVVFDIHHHYCNTAKNSGVPVLMKYSDPLVQRVIDTWGDVRPKMHVSQSRVLDYISDMSKLIINESIDGFTNEELSEVEFDDIVTSIHRCVSPLIPECTVSATEVLLKHVNPKNAWNSFKAHHDVIDDPRIVETLIEYSQSFDIMVEAKHKNIASINLLNLMKTKESQNKML